MKQIQKRSLIPTLHVKLRPLSIPMKKNNDFSNLKIFSSLRLLTKFFSRQILFETLLPHFMHD